MTIDEFRDVLAYTSMEATNVEKREARRLVKVIAEKNKVLFKRLAKL